MSHNNGRSDAHDLIPSDVWFSNFIEGWRNEYFATFESLGIEYAAYERLDKRKTQKNESVLITNVSRSIVRAAEEPQHHRDFSGSIPHAAIATKRRKVRGEL